MRDWNSRCHKNTKMCWLVKLQYTLDNLYMSFYQTIYHMSIILVKIK